MWVTNITEHHTYEGKVYCAVVLHAFSRRVVGWSIDSSETAALVTNALGMAIADRDPQSGGIIHSNRGVQFTSWAFTDRVKRSGLIPSMGSIGDYDDNAMVESFWGRMQIELLNRKRWKARIELANAIFDYLEISTIADAAIPPTEGALRFRSNYYTKPPSQWPETKYGGTTEPRAHRGVNQTGGSPRSGAHETRGAPLMFEYEPGVGSRLGDDQGRSR